MSDIKYSEINSNVQIFKEIFSKNISITLKLLTHFKILQGKKRRDFYENIPDRLKYPSWREL